MANTTRKQREMERRAEEILRVSRPILIEEGFAALSMDRVAALMEYAKGTIYNHFPNKEEIVVALAYEAMELRRSLFERAAKVQGSTRVRMMAIGFACEFFTQECTDDFLVEQWIRNNSIWDKSSEQRQNLIRQCEGSCMTTVAGLVIEAVERQELHIPESLTPQEFVFGLWALNYGSQILTFSSPSLKDIGIVNPIQAIRFHCMTILNGFRWEPLMEWDAYLTQMNLLTEQLTPDFLSICEERKKDKS